MVAIARQTINCGPSEDSFKPGLSHMRIFVALSIGIYSFSIMWVLNTLIRLIRVFVGLRVMRGFRKFRHVGCDPEIFFLSSIYSTEEPTDHIEKQLGPIPVFLREHRATCHFPREGGGGWTPFTPLDPPIRVYFAGFVILIWYVPVHLLGFS